MDEWEKIEYKPISVRNLLVEIKNLSELIGLSLQAPEKIFADVLFSRTNNLIIKKNTPFTMFLKQNYSKNRENCLLMLNKIRSLFNKSPDLNHQQKMSYCSIERHFMKLFLKTCL